MVWDARLQLLVMASVVNPAQSQFLGHQLELRRVVAQKQANHWIFDLSVVGSHRCCFKDPTSLLRPQKGNVRVQPATKFRFTHVLVAWHILQTLDHPYGQPELADKTEGL